MIISEFLNTFRQFSGFVIISPEESEMQKRILFLVCIFAFVSSANSQNLFYPKIDSIKNLVSSQVISKYDRELSGDTVTTVGGNPVRIISRKTNSPFNPVAAQYIFEKFISFGINARYQVNNSTCVNVIATKTGIKYPNKQYIVCAHYDNYSNNSTDTIPGADDNASGICSVLEAARLLSNFNMDYTVKFIAFDEEEDWMIGSYAYVDSAYAKGDSIMGVLNLDMIGFDPNSLNIYNLYTNNASVSLSSGFISASYIYQVPVLPVETISETTASDHLPFWQKGYKALFAIERTFNYYYHTQQETYDKLKLSYLTNIVKASIIALASWGTDRYISVLHKPANSGYDTSAKVLIFKVQSPVKLGMEANIPRVYYKTNNGSYVILNASYSGNDTLKFIIPGQSPGTSVTYYFAVQDSAGSACITFPQGGNGINPPGTTPPQNTFRYDIYLDYNQCSNTLPKPINDLQFTYDTIPVNQSTKLVNKIKVNLTINHPNDGDIIIQLRGPNGQINLSQGNGSGGANYINTTFDDSASISITQGTPPFTGSYKPQYPLSYFNNQPASGPWVLRIFDSKAGNTGSLINWCMIFQLKNTVSVNGNNIPMKFGLSQNYPNPFNPVTRIPYSIAENSFVSLKIYDVLGREVKTLVSEKQTAGEYEVLFNASDLNSGVYFYRLTSGNFTETKKLILLK